jgi:hypothetical protein
MNADCIRSKSRTLGFLSVVLGVFALAVILSAPRVSRAPTTEDVALELLLAIGGAGFVVSFVLSAMADAVDLIQGRDPRGTPEEHIAAIQRAQESLRGAYGIQHAPPPQSPLR